MIFGRAVSSLSFVLSVLPVATAADDYPERVRPFLAKHCVSCHSGKKARGELDFDRYSKSDDLIRDFRRWNNVLEFVRKGQMPPADSPQPTPKEREAVVGVIENILLADAMKHAGDPGEILPRRLSNTEYDLSVSQLIGVEVRPTKDFPVDPAGGEGFDNTGEALSMSPSLLRKYLGAAQLVAGHLVLGSDGIRFAPFPVTSYNERKKLTEGELLDFYRDHEVRVTDYLEAAWRFRHRADRAVDAAGWAGRSKLSAKYLALVIETLDHAAAHPVGHLKPLGEMWSALPAPTDAKKLPDEFHRLTRFVEFCRTNLSSRDDGLIKSNAGNWPIGHLDFRARTAEARDRFDASRLTGRSVLKFEKIRAGKRPQERAGVVFHIRVDPVFEGGEGWVIIRKPVLSKANELPRNRNEETKNEVETLRAVLLREVPQTAEKLGFGRHPLGHAIDADSFAVKAPALVEIALSVESTDRLDGKYLIATCELDAEHSKEGGVYVRRSTGKPPADSYGPDPVLLVHAGSRTAEAISASADRICRAFPNRFFYVDSQRGLAAGFHLVEGFFRDDLPLMRKVLTDAEVAELNRLWRELDFVTDSAETLLRGFVWFERAERHVLHDKRFDFLRSEDPSLVQEELLGKFERAYLGKLGVTLVGDTLTPEKPSAQFNLIHGFFEQVRAGLKLRREMMPAAEAKALRDMEVLARRAYRRELKPREVESLRTLYKTVREQGLGIEDSLRSVFTAVLMSPAFCYRLAEAPAGAGVSPMSGDALASRLSYFLWSSAPDEPLLAAAAGGKLTTDAELKAQTRRMLADPRMAHFAREFLGQWLRYRDFLIKDPVHGAAFPGYTDEVRQAMFEEPVRLATYLIRQDRPITDLLGSDVTFVNAALAAHYGGGIAEQHRSRSAKWIEELKSRDLPVPADVRDQWHMVDGLLQEGRGGLLGMGVILTRNSTGERTSPVKRGFWAVHRLLGQHFPPPPADVPELPKAEKTAEKTIRELLAAHTSNASCAMCHTHFDGLGLALEGFDPVGRKRTKDLAGRPVDDLARLPDGKTAKGVPGLIKYLESERRRDFVDTLCRKFLGYALGRSVALSDRPLLDEMRTALEKNGYRFSVLFETVVLSRQFRNLRGRDFVIDTR